MAPRADTQAPLACAQRSWGRDLLAIGKNGCGAHAEIDPNHAIAAGLRSTKPASPLAVPATSRRSASVPSLVCHAACILEDPVDK